MRRRLLSLIAVVVVALLLPACTTSTQAVIPGTATTYPPPGTPTVYVAVGASETAGVGADFDRARDAWPSAFYLQAMSTAASYYNLGIPDETTAQALVDEVPRAVALHPTVATVWLNVDDIVNGVPVQLYESQLDQLVQTLRQGGHTTVLVANTPVMDGLPLVRACLGEQPEPQNAPKFPPLFPGGPQRDACTVIAQNFGGTVTAAELDARVAAYNAAIARVVARDGAVLVDLHAQGDVATLDPNDIDDDGFHPSDQGHLAIAKLFAAAYGHTTS